MNDANIINPKLLFNSKRLDLVIKYLFAKEILEEENNAYNKGIYKDLYIRHILMRTMGIEPADIWIKRKETAKNNIEDYIKSFKELILSIKNYGYDFNNPIPLYNDLLANGAHRIAAAYALDSNISIQNVSRGYSWDFDWFVNNGFNTEDKQRILKGFVDIHPDKCAIFVVWNPLLKYIDNVKSIMKNFFDIVGEVELDFEDNYIAFTNALLEIYEPNIQNSGGDETTIREKAKLLQANYLSFKVIVVTNQEKNSDKDISELSKNCKNDIRDLFNHILPKECFCTVHSSDGEAETRYLAAILLSPNNIKHLKMRLSCKAGLNFVRRIRNLPSFLQTLGIFDPNDVCVIGSGVMTALGVQEDSDSDFITDYKYRDKLGMQTVYLNDDYDIGICDKVANRPKNISDNILIHNCEYHFWFKGIKFANLEIIKDRKKHSARDKDLVHLRQIDLFEKMTGHIEQQKILRERIEAEQLRRAAIREESVPIVNQPCDMHYTLPEKIFSVKNEYGNNKKYKVITAMGIKMKFGQKAKTLVP